MNNEWRLFSKEKPSKEGKYLVCDQYGKVTIKYFGEDEGYFYKGSWHGEEATNVYFWTNIPETPNGLAERQAQIEALEKQKRKLAQKIEELKKQNKFH